MDIVTKIDKLLVERYVKYKDFKAIMKAISAWNDKNIKENHKPEKDWFEYIVNGDESRFDRDAYYSGISAYEDFKEVTADFSKLCKKLESEFITVAQKHFGKGAILDGEFNFDYTGVAIEFSFNTSDVTTNRNFVRELLGKMPVRNKKEDVVQVQNRNYGDHPGMIIWIDYEMLGFNLSDFDEEVFDQLLATIKKIPADGEFNFAI